MESVSDQHAPAFEGDHATLARRQLAGALAAAAIGGYAGYFHGDGIIAGGAGLWNDWLLPTFVKMYLYGVALCS